MEGTGIFVAGKGVMLPQDERARNILGKLSPGDKVLVHVHKARWPEHNRLAWLFFTRVGEAIGKTPRQVATWLKVVTGRVDFIEMPNGKVVAAPQSISFESMGQDEFQRFWDEAVAIVCEHILPGTAPEAFDDIAALIAGKKAEAA